MGTDPRTSAPAKITAPVPTQVVGRPRLDRTLDDALARSMTWISGPGGCGKTTLVASYLQAQRRATLWYQGDAGDTDPGTLFHFLRHACEQAAPTSTNPLPPAFGPEFLPGMTVFTRRYFRSLFSRLDANVVVVFDNLDSIPAGSAFYEILREAAFEIPRSAHVIFCSRSEPHPALTRFVATREMTRIGWEQLRFTEEEAQALLERLSPRGYDAPALARILGLTQGWAAGLILLATEGEWGDLVANGSVGQTGEMLFDYFATEVFRDLDRTRQDFLLKTAFLSKVTPTMARELTGDPEAEVVLNELRRRNFFTVHRPPSDVYEYHPLFRRFLQHRAEAGYADDEIAAIKRAAAASSARNGLVDDAAKLFLELNDWDSLGELVNNHARELITQARYSTLESWLEAIPERVLEAWPWLSYWLGTSRMLFKPVEAETALRRAYQRFRLDNDATGSYLSWANLVGTLANSEHYIARLGPCIDEFHDLVAEHPHFPSLEIECRVAVNLVAGLAANQPSHPDIDYWGRRALALAEQSGDIESQLEALFYRFHSLLLTQTHEDRALLLAKMSGFLHQPGVSDFSRIRANGTQAAHQLFTGDFQKCIEIATDTLALAERTGIFAFNPLLLLWIGWSSFYRGDVATARDMIKRMERPCGEAQQTPEIYSRLLRGIDCYLGGDLPQTVVEIRTALDRLSQGETWAHVIIGFVLIRSLCELGRADEADQALAPLLSFAWKTNNQMMLHHCLLCSAEISLSRGQRQSALAELNAAMASGRGVDVHYAFIWRPSALAKLCVLALEHDIEPEVVQRMVHLRGLRPETAPRHLDNWPWAIKIFTLGEFAIERQGVRLSLLEKAYRKPLELLQALIALGGPRGLNLARVQDALWPDAEGDAAKHNFEVTLSRLRKIIDLKDAIELRHGVLSLSQHLCWVDAWALKEVISELTSAIKDPQGTSAPGEIEPLEARLGSLDGGRLLDSVLDVPWAEKTRTDLCSTRARLYLDLGHYWQAHARPEQAALCYEKGLAYQGIPGSLRGRLQDAITCLLE